jgi:hypothetical protein
MGVMPNVSFDLHKLGWSDFQKLCSTVLTEILGQPPMVFSAVNDAGMDGMFEGEWQTGAGRSVRGRTIIQCKHKSTQAGLVPSDLSAEIPKITRLIKHTPLDSYVILTNAPLSGQSALAIEQQFLAAGAKQVALYGKEWFDTVISSSQRLRMLVPRLYGLGDLTQILDSRAYSQATAVLDSMKEDIAKVVLVKPYLKALECLRTEGVVLLVGEPMAGKSTIAACAAIAAIDERGANVIKLDHISDFTGLWNPHESSQLFWLDDVFGVIRYDPTAVQRWDRTLPKIKAALASGTRIILTSVCFPQKRIDTAAWLVRRSLGLLVACFGRRIRVGGRRLTQ